jgi:hypothetical protein
MEELLSQIIPFTIIKIVLPTDSGKLYEKC